LRIKFVVYISFMVLLFSAVCSAQVAAPGETPETVSAFTGAQFYSRTLEGETEESVQQLVFPIFVTAMIAENLNIRAYQTVSTAELDDASLNGLENTRIRGAYGLFRNRLITYLGLSLPIGGVTPEEETERLNELLYSEPLQFGVSRLTGGFDLDAGFAFAQPFGAMSFGLGAGYVLRGSYDRLSQGDGVISYDPGNALSGTAGFYLNSGVTDLRCGILYAYYGDDSTDGGSFENGNELTFSIAGVFNLDPLTLTVFSADTRKGESDAEGIEVTNLFTNRLSGGLSLAYSLLDETLTLKTQADIKRLTYDGDTRASVVSLGGGFHLVITDNVALDVSAGIISGDMDDGETEISGFDLSSIIRFGF
jgi:hypothetical protein